MFRNNNLLSGTYSKRIKEGNTKNSKIYWFSLLHSSNRCIMKAWIGRSGDRIPLGARFSAPVLTGPTQPPTQWVPVFPGGKAAGAWR